MKKIKNVYNNYIYFVYDKLGRIVEVKTGGEVTERYSYATKGRTVTVTDGKGSDYVYSYDAFGSPYLGNLENDIGFGYCGKSYDTGTGLYDYGFRDYSPVSARFTTIDPIRDGANWFAYVVNDPVNYVDLLGLSATDKKTEVYIFRLDDGLGNEFNSTRVIFKDGVCEYVDGVGANCSEKKYDEKKGNITEPDGVYYYTADKLTNNGDGTYDSDSYHNVLRHKTDDPSIPKEIRDIINNSPGDFLDHANQQKEKNIYSTTHPYGAGCTIGQGGQEHQDDYMSVLMDGVKRPEDIKRVVISVNHK